jgi:cytoskeletal protein CcmA (bactofilin family)
MLDRDRSTAPSPESAGTFLGADVEFKGSLKFKDQLRINGKFEGELSSSGTVHVGPQGDVRADVNVGGAVVEGKVNGNINASDRIELRATAQMIGDIKAAKLIVEEGVVFVGRCEVSSDKTRVPSMTGSESGKRKEQVASQSGIEVGLGA